LAKFNPFARHDVSEDVIREGISVDGTEEGIHSLPVVVQVVTIEEGIKVADPIERHAGRTSFEEHLWSNGVADDLHPVAINNDRVRGPVVKLVLVEFREGQR